MGAFDPTQDPIVERNVEMTARDGTRLRADVYRPGQAGRYPVLLRRTPYGKNLLSIGDPVPLARRGYMVVIQDIRGRFASEGDFEWSFGNPDRMFDATDGYDAVEWAATLDGSNGQVGTFGCSYDAWTQWQLAPLDPPSLNGMAVAGMGPDMLSTTRGIFDIGRRLQWLNHMAADIRSRSGSVDGPMTRPEAEADWELQRGKWLWHIPLSDIPEHVFSGLHTQLQEHLRNITRQSYDFRESYNRVSSPTLHVTGWWDRLNDTIENYVGMVSQGPSDLRDRHRLIVGPWSHNPASWGAEVGILDHGPSAAEKFEDHIADFFDWSLKGNASRIDLEAPVRLFITGINQWRDESEWPLERAVPTDLFLRSDGQANRMETSGWLSVQPATNEPPDAYIYDARDPVMSTMSEDSHHAPVDQRPLDRRRDIIRYATEPLSKPIMIVGDVELVLWASSDAPDTDWTGKLIDVHPDGRAVNLSSGIIRASHRRGYDKPLLLETDDPYEYRLRLSPIGHVFQPGHRLRLDVSSSDFPNYDRNHNTGKPFWSDNELRRAYQRAFHDRSRPSRLILPVIPDESGRQGWPG